MEIINTQWLYRAEAEIVRETKSQFLVKLKPPAGSEGAYKVRRFWKNNGLEVGYSRIIKMGCEPDKLIHNQE